jgi:multidrug resistance efflux pump
LSRRSICDDLHRCDVIWINQNSTKTASRTRSGRSRQHRADIRPGRVFPGKIESVGWGVDSRDIDPLTGLPTIRNDSGWVREAQRFAVRIEFEPDKRPKGILLGSQANVVVYTGRSALTDTIGRWWIWAVAYLSYLG